MSGRNIEDLPQTEEISEDELEKVSGGLNVSSLGVKQSSLSSIVGAFTSPTSALLSLGCGNEKMATGQSGSNSDGTKSGP
jgi:bacteriocin-like protein